MSLSFVQLPFVHFVQLCWQWGRLRLAAVANGGWWWWVLLAMGVALSGCKSRWVPLSDSTVRETTITSRDTIVSVPALRHEHIFDTLPLHVPVFATDSSQRITLQLTRRNGGVEADVRVRERHILVPRSSVTRTDTVRIERLIGQAPNTNRKWWQGLWPGLLLGALLVLGLRLLFR